MGGEESTLLGGGKKCIGPEQMERMRPLDRRLMDGLLLGLCLPDRCAVVCMCYVYILALQLCVSLASCLQLLICVPHGISMSGLCPAQSVFLFFFFFFEKEAICNFKRYFDVFIWLHWVLVTTGGIFSLGM